MKALLVSASIKNVSQFIAKFSENMLLKKYSLHMKVIDISSVYYNQLTFTKKLRKKVGQLIRNMI